MTSDTLLRQEFHELYKSCADEQAGGGEIIDYFKLEDEVMALVSKAVEEVRLSGIILVLQSLEHDYRQHKVNIYELVKELIEDYKAELTGKGGQNG